MIGSIVGSYRIVERLGAGGMGDVYRAEHLHLDRQAAIKMILVELSCDRETVDRLFSEARATSSIRHPGIVEVLDCSTHEDGRAYLVMELLTGETLGARLARAPRFGDDVRAVLDVTDQIASAIGAAHERGIVHRDLKPENVFLVGGTGGPEARGPRVKVLDFGIAKLMAARGGEGAAPPSHVQTRADRLLGTPAYMSPEQCRDARSVDRRTDIYSLGCVVFEMLSGRTPFLGNSFGQILAAQMWQPPPPLRRVRSNVAPSLAALVERMLAKEPAARPATMEEVRSDLARVRESLGALEAGAPSPARWRSAILSVVARVVPVVRVVRVWPSTWLSSALSPFWRGRRRPPMRSARSVVGLLGLGCFVVASGAALVVVCDRADRDGRADGNEPPARGAVASKRAPVAASPPAPARSPPRTIRIDIADAPPDLSVVVDGRPAVRPPLTLAAGPGLHDVVFRAPGYEDRQLWLDGRASRPLTLGMRARREGTPLEVPSPAVSVPPDERNGFERGGAPLLRRARRSPGSPGLSDELRKL